MAKSRADFMREMGISMDDVEDPAVKPTKYPSRVGRGGDDDDDEDREQNRRHQQPSAAPASRVVGGGGMAKSTPSKATPLSQTRDVSDFGAAPRGGGASRPSAPISETSSRAPTSSSYATGGSSGSTANSAARAEFLRALGLGENDMTHPDSPVKQAGRSVNNAGAGAKENTMPRDYGASGNENSSGSFTTAKAKTRAMLQRAHEDDDDDVHVASSVRSTGKPQQPTSQSSYSGDYSYRAQPSSNTTTTTSSASALDDPRQLRGLKPSSHMETDIPADATAEDIKNMGNQAFEVGDFRKAVRMYSRAIDKDPRNAALYSNRSAAYLQGGKQMGLDTRSMALRDADKAIEVKPQWFKGYSRRGDALFKLERWAEAVESYETALRIDPTNTSVQFSLRECQQMLPKAKADSWSQPRELMYGDQPIKSSGSSGSFQSSKTARQLAEEMRRDADRAGDVLGHDYRDEELQRFRATRSNGTASGHASVETSFKGDEYEKFTKPQLDRNNIAEEFSSSAAAAYQRSLLDAYRKKKQQQ